MAGRGAAGWLTGWPVDAGRGAAVWLTGWPVDAERGRGASNTDLLHHTETTCAQHNHYVTGKSLVLLGN